MVDISTLENGVELRHQQLRLKVETWGENSLRVRASLLEIDEQVWALLKQKEIKPEIDIVPEKVTVRNGEMVTNIYPISTARRSTTA